VRLRTFDSNKDILIDPVFINIHINNGMAYDILIKRNIQQEALLFLLMSDKKAV
jgi:hypothetical protein